MLGNSIFLLLIILYCIFINIFRNNPHKIIVEVFIIFLLIFFGADNLYRDLDGYVDLYSYLFPFPFPLYVKRIVFKIIYSTIYCLILFILYKNGYNKAHRFVFLAITLLTLGFNQLALSISVLFLTLSMLIADTKFKIVSLLGSIFFHKSIVIGFTSFLIRRYFVLYIIALLYFLLVIIAVPQFYKYIYFFDHRISLYTYYFDYYGIYLLQFKERLDLFLLLLTITVLIRDYKLIVVMILFIIIKFFSYNIPSVLFLRSFEVLAISFVLILPKEKVNFGLVTMTASIFLVWDLYSRYLYN